MIRTITRDDVPQCIELGRRQHAESKLNYLNLDMEKIKYGFLSAVDHPTRRVFVIDVDGKIVGNRALEIQFNYAHGDENDRMGKLLNKLGYKKYCDQYKKLMI